MAEGTGKQMKVDLSIEELQVLMAPGERAQAEVVRLNAEVAKLNSQLAVMSYPHTDMGNEYRSVVLNALANVCAQSAHGNKIAAIKIVRELTGIGLKEAKDVVEGNYTGPGFRRIG